jgi:tetratricopeptide (TPR) repeat protein
METINETAITNQAPLPNQRACGARTIHAVKGRLPKGYGARIYALSELGYFLTDNAGLHDEAEACLREALKIAQEIGDAYGQAHIFLGLAFADFQRQRNASSLDNTSKALELFQKIPTECARYREIDCRVRLGMIHRKTGDYPAAVLTAEKGLEVADKHRLVGWKGELNSGLGFHLRAQGKFEAAIKCHKEALNIFSQLSGMRREEAVQCSYLGNLYTDLGFFDDAQKSFEKAEDIAKAIDLRRELSWILANRGVLYCRLGDYEKAFDLQQQALTIVKVNTHLDSQVIRFTDLSATFLAMGKSKEAGKALLEALNCAAQDEKIVIATSLPEAYLGCRFLEDKLPHEMQSPHDHLRRGAILARIYLHSNDLTKALQVIELAQAQQHELNPHKHLLTALYAIIVHRLGRLNEARMAYRKAVEYAGDILLRTPQYYPAQYTRGLALAGLSTLSKDQARDTFIRRAREAYQKAFDICKAAGVLNDAISLWREVPSEDDPLTSFAQNSGHTTKSW